MIRGLLLTIFLIPFLLTAQLSTSQLPIMIINTQDSAEIMDYYKIEASISIIHDAEALTNDVNSTDYSFTSKIGIEIRGESSQGFPKKSYLFTTWDNAGNDRDASFLNFPEEEDFILYAPYADKSLLNNALAMRIASDMGRYASRTRFVELVVNGSYEGVYLIMEKIKVGEGRLDISRLKPGDNIGDELTGGYVVRIDKGEHEGWSSQFKAYEGWGNIFFQYFYPKAENMEPEQKFYIKAYMDAFEQAMGAENFMSEQGYHYSDYINLRSFIDNFLLVELSKNVDGYRLSTYFHKDRDSENGRLFASPAWDYNLSFGNADYCSGDDMSGWMYYQCAGGGPFWWDSMLEDEMFRNGLKCRWESLRSGFLSTTAIMSWIDEMATNLSEPAKRNFIRWPILGSYVWPNPSYFVTPLSYNSVITQMKQNIQQRLVWMDENMPGEATDCEFYDDLNKLGTVVNSEDLQAKPTVTVFPNPANEQVTIQADLEISSLSLHDLLGHEIDRVSLEQENYTWTLKRDIPDGMYLLTVTMGGQVVTKMLALNQ